MNRKLFRLRASKSQTGTSILTLFIAVGLICSFVGCSFMFGKMLVSGSSQMDHSGQMAATQMEHSAPMSHGTNNQTAPVTEECCEAPQMGQALQIQSSAPKVILAPALFFILLGSLSYLSLITKQANLNLKGLHLSPPQPRFSLLAQKTQLLQ